MKIPLNLLELMEEAGIVGRGGAGFPTHLKWKRLKDLCAPVVYVVCNASEGELSVRKDGYILERFPEKVVSGMLAAMEFLGAKEAWFNINAEYFKLYGPRLAEITTQAANENGLEFHFFIEKPSYIGGETGALLNAIEGKRTQPRLSPPSPSIAGINGNPVLLDNVETFYDVARLLEGSFQPTRFITVSGPVDNPGVYELPRESTVLNALQTTKNVPAFPYFVQVGGSASGEVISAEQAESYVVNGCGAIEVYDGVTPAYDMLKRWIDFYATESCGKCAPCREGTYRLRKAMEQAETSRKPPWGLIQKTMRSMKTSSFCDLGLSLPVVIESYMKNVLSMMLNVTIDGSNLLARRGQTILQVMNDNDVYLPHFCYHEDFEVEANCRTCMVEIVQPGKGMKQKAGEILSACNTPAAEGLVVDTQSPHIRNLRRENQELLLSRQKLWHTPMKLTEALRAASEIDGVDFDSPVPNPPPVPVLRMGPCIEIDPNICIACNLCVKACESAGIGFLTLKGTAVSNRVSRTDDPAVHCIYCGQCTLHCPVAAAREQSHIEGVKKAIQDPSKVVIVQMAPAVRVSVGELFGMKPGTNLEKRLNAAFRKLGFDRVFDVNWGADVTTIVEAEELVERIEHKGVMPMFTSCCPAWVRFVETSYPEFIPNLTTSRSPQIHAGAAYKTWWANREGIDPKRLVVVSIMPCTSKKYEASLDTLRVDGMLPVDYVLTSRELAEFISERGIDFDYLSPEEADSLSEYSGAAALYGASGGVMEAALRTAAWRVLGDDLATIEFSQVRGLDGVKTAQVRLGDRFLNVAVVSTISHARIVLEEIRRNPGIYDYVEFMACPGGCLGGGGQPQPSSKAIVRERMSGIYRIDAMKALRLAHRNDSAMQFVEYCRSKGPQREKDLLFRNYEAVASHE